LGTEYKYQEKFKFFEVTADVGYRAYGRDLEEAFENAALALFEVMTDTGMINPLIEKNVTLESEDQCALLYDWLSELIFLHDAEFLVFSQFKVKIEKKSEDSYILKASAWGEEFDPSRNEIRNEVKAVTYHLMDIKEENGYILQVILDI
jgi:SHS2 domain-containing protein